MTRIDSTGREVCEYCGYGVPQHGENCDRPFPAERTASVLFEGSVPTSALETVSERVAKVARRAERRGFPSPSMTLGATEVRVHQVPCSALAEGAVEDAGGYHRNVPVEYTAVSIVADAPLRVNGWRLVGVVAAASGGVALVSDVPGESTRGVVVADPEHCDHCGARRKRAETFLVRHDDGTLRQVGRQCLRDFLGHDPAALLAGLDAFRELRFSDAEVEAWGMAAPRLYEVSDIIRSAARVVATTGWYVSRAKAEESEFSARPVPSTASETRWVLDPPRPTRGEERPSERYPVGEKVEALVAATLSELEALRSKPAAERSDWEEKLVVYTAVDAVQNRHVGMVASAVILGLRLQERPEPVAKAPAAILAPVGERVRGVEATVTFTRDFENEWGQTRLVRLESERDGVRYPLTWWASRERPEVGQTLVLTGTVKKHEEDRFTHEPTTVLTRVKLGA